MSHQNQKEEITKNIANILSTLSIKDRVEVLANVYILEGLQGIPAVSSINSSNVHAMVLNDRKTNGETIYNAMALQGLMTLMWLQN